MPQVVAKLLELVEDHQVLAGFAQLPALVEDFFDVRFAARGGDHLAGDLGEPLEALAAHPFGQDGDRLAGQQGRIVGAAAAEVAGGRPDSFLGGRVELAGHQARDQAAEGRADFMRAGGEPFADQGDNARRRCRSGWWATRCNSRRQNRRPEATGSFFQVMRNRLRGFTSHKPVAAQLRLDFGRERSAGFSSGQRLG